MSRSFRALLVCALSAVISTGTSAQEARPQFETRADWKERCPSLPPDDAAQKDVTFKAAIVAGLIAVIAPKLIEGVVDSAAEALKAAGNDKSDVSRAKVGADFYGVSQEGDVTVRSRCLVIVRGEFDDKKGSPIAWTTKDPDEVTFKGLQRAIFHLELQLKPMSGNKHFQLVPLHLQVDDFERFAFFDPVDRDYSVAISLSAAGEAQPFASTEVVFSKVRRGQVFKIDDWQMRNATTRPMAFPAESADATNAKAARAKYVTPFLTALDILKAPKPKLIPNEPERYPEADTGKAFERLCEAVDNFNETAPEASQISETDCTYRVVRRRAELQVKKDAAHLRDERVIWADTLCPMTGDTDKKTRPTAVTGCNLFKKDTELNDKSFTYLTTDVVLTETSGGSKVAAFAGKVLSSAKDDVSTVLKDELPKTKEQKEALESTARGARRGVLLADMAIIQAEESLGAELANKQEGDQLAKTTAARIALAKAKIAANDAYRAAGLPPPYSEFE